MALAQLHREAQIGRETSHPNLIALLAANLNDETPHLVFPYVLGTSARQLLVCEQRIPIAFALWVIRQASEALEVLHRAGYRHGDIQPDNLLISPNWHVTVIDLGLARGADEDANYHQQWLTGTLGYAAPELFLAGSNVAPAADIYSLGATLYEFVTGVRPDQSEANQRWKHERSGPSEGRYVDLKHLCPIASTQLARLTREMLASNPNQRPSLSQLIARLRRLEMFHLADRSRMIA
jgi:serine/threonine-protein kinase